MLYTKSVGKSKRKMWFEECHKFYSHPQATGYPATLIYLTISKASQNKQRDLLEPRMTYKTNIFLPC